MGDYAEEQRQIHCLKLHKEDYEYKLVEIKKIFTLPILYIKQNKKNYRRYDLFNIIPLYKVYETEGFTKWKV